MKTTAKYSFASDLTKSYIDTLDLNSQSLAAKKITQQQWEANRNTINELMCQSNKDAVSKCDWLLKFRTDIQLHGDIQL